MILKKIVYFFIIIIEILALLKLHHIDYNLFGVFIICELAKFLLNINFPNFNNLG